MFELCHPMYYSENKESFTPMISNICSMFVIHYIIQRKKKQFVTQMIFIFDSMFELCHPLYYSQNQQCWQWWLNKAKKQKFINKLLEIYIIFIFNLCTVLNREKEKYNMEDTYLSYDYIVCAVYKREGGVYNIHKLLGIGENS